MSAPSIPNLLSLRSGTAGRGRGRGLGRGRGGPRSGAPGSGAGPSHDDTIQGTDTDAAVSRLSAVELGYLSDPFARLFVQAAPGPATRRLPIINRGTYTRTTAIDTLVDRFLATTDPAAPRQIVSLGAGTDTRSLRLFASPRAHRNVAYHEIDFPAITARKRSAVQSTPSLRAVLSDPEPLSPTTWRSRSAHDPAANNTLTVHGVDLRTLTPDTPPLPGISPTAPTLVLSECCLCYLPPATARSVLAHFTSLSSSSSSSSSSSRPHEHGPTDSSDSSSSELGVVLYEPIGPDDAFGRTMAANLAARGISMPTVAAYPTAAAQERRLREECGLAEARCETVDAIWDGWVGPAEKARVDSLEGGLDEVEEWRLLAGHYVVAWGWRGGGGMDLEVAKPGGRGKDGEDEEDEGDGGSDG